MATISSYSASAGHSTISNSPQQSATVPTPGASSPAGATATRCGPSPVAGSHPHAHLPTPTQHKRVYQACIPCRRRKVRCDLGSVDEPHDPPCVRCRRESKECFFSATRRKRKAGDDSDEPDLDDYIVRNGRKRLRANDAPAVRFDPRYFTDYPLTPGRSSARLQPLRRPHRGEKSQPDAGYANANVPSSEEPNPQVENIEARTVMRAGMYGPHDALDLLYKAATDSPAIGGAAIEVSNASGHACESLGESPRLPAAPIPSRALHSHTRSLSSTHAEASRTAAQFPQAEAHPIDPELAVVGSVDVEKPGYADATKAWTSFRFVRAGWFTAQEAIDYIDYYYEYLSPLTPISPPTFRNPAVHLNLLTEEPILTVTLLTISSRYRCMPGTGGHCRSHAIHEQLWSYLRGMIERCLWGQEAFGGGFCGSGADESQTSSTAPWRGLRKGSLRTLGTIESLMILTEWHPRALHFPPSEAIDELMLPCPHESRCKVGTEEEAGQRVSAGVGGRRIESWLEPAWRSDRMCWMLLSTAMGLAYELGVFDDIDDLLATEAITRPEYEDESYRLRAYRIKRLLLIYLTQLAGRLGWTSMVPDSLRKTDPAVSRKRPSSVEGTTPCTSQSVLSNSFNYIPDLELDDQIIHCWAGISNAMHIGNAKLFRSRKHTTDIIQSGKYLTLLKEFRPMLRDWWAEFDRFRLPPYMRHILKIEYEYVRIYINSLSLQAVVERCTSNASVGAQGGGSGATTAQLSPQTQHYYGKLPLGQLGGFGAADQEYIREVVDGSRSLLRTVVNGLLPGNYLKHAPVRTYFRIISGAMFLLKTFALGATKSDVEESIGLMDQTVDALQNCVVDDVHLGIRFADLLESLTSRLRTRFINVHAGPNAPTSHDGRSPSHVPHDSGPPPPEVTDTSSAAAAIHVTAIGSGESHSWLSQFPKIPGMYIPRFLHHANAVDGV